MFLGELEGEGHVLPSWTGSNFDHYNELTNSAQLLKKTKD